MVSLLRGTHNKKTPRGNLPAGRKALKTHSDRTVIPLPVACPPPGAAMTRQSRRNKSRVYTFWYTLSRQESYLPMATLFSRVAFYSLLAV